MSDVADKEWLAAYRRGWEGRNAPLERAPFQPVWSEEFRAKFQAHLAYLDRLIAGIKDLDTAASEQRIRRACAAVRRKAGHVVR